jgi:ATP-dependent HslUV protease subunit HslV
MMRAGRRLIAVSSGFNKRYSLAPSQVTTRGLAGGVEWHGTTILAVRKNGQTVMGGDGQVSMGSSVMKGNAKKVRKIGSNILVGFAGSTADALTLVERLEKKLDEHPGQLMRACVELAKAWRTEKYLRRLEAVLLVADKDNIFELTGNGDVLEPEKGVMGVGSGGQFAYSAALALIDQEGVEAEEIVRRSMKIAGDICVYTNHSLRIEKLEPGDAEDPEDKPEA